MKVLRTYFLVSPLTTVKVNPVNAERFAFSQALLGLIGNKLAHKKDIVSAPQTIVIINNLVSELFAAR
jgi:hypothetical protein